MTTESKLKDSMKQHFKKMLTEGKNISITAFIIKEVNSKCIPFYILKKITYYYCRPSMMTQLVKKICLQCRRPRFNSCIRKICWRSHTFPTPVFLGFPFGTSGILKKIMYYFREKVRCYSSVLEFKIYAKGTSLVVW